MTLTARTLVLDVGYRPIQVTSWQRAVTLFFDEKVEVVEAYEVDIHSVSLTMQMPAVVRLLRSFRRHRGAVRFTRINVARRDGFRCQYCAVQLPLGELTYDHVIPRAHGGRTNWGNIVMACVECNRRKGGRTPREAGMRLRRQPERPKTLPPAHLRLDPKSVPEAWRSWLYWYGALHRD